MTDCVVPYAGQEYTSAVGANAWYNVGLVLSHNTVENDSYGAFSVGAGAARPGYARNDTASYNRVARFMLKMSVQTLGVLVLLEPFPHAFVAGVRAPPPPHTRRGNAPCLMPTLIGFWLICLIRAVSDIYMSLF